MSVLLITYEHTKAKPDSDPVRQVISKYKHVQLGNNSYAIETYEATRTIYNKLNPFFTNSGQFFILTITKPFSGNGLEDVKNWLGKHLPQY